MINSIINVQFAVIDFEASSLGSASWPVEVGVAICSGGAKVETWSTLIRPHSTWSLAAWDYKAERIHGIPLSALDDGLAPASVLIRLNDLLGPIGWAFCDGGQFDHFWFEQLCKAGSLVRPAFELRDLTLAFDANEADRARFEEMLAQTTAPHRAGPDSERLCVALIQTLNHSRETPHW